MPSPSSSTCKPIESLSRQLWMRTVVPSGAYLAALSKRLNRTCSNRTGSISTIGKFFARSTSTRCRARILLVRSRARSEEHTSELQSPCNLVCRLLLEKKKKKQNPTPTKKNKQKKTRI